MLINTRNFSPRRIRRTTKKDFVNLRALRGLFVFTVFLLVGCTAPPVATSSPTAAKSESTPTETVQVVVPPMAQFSQILAGVDGNNNYDFIELSNPGSDAPFDLRGMSLWYQLADGGEAELVYQWDEHALIPPGGFYLLGRAVEDYGLPVEAFIETPLVPQRGGLQLRAADNTVLDSLVWGNGPQTDFGVVSVQAMSNGVALVRNRGAFVLNSALAPRNTTLFGDLQIALEAPATVNPGEEFIYSLTLRNVGAVPASGLTAQIPIANDFEIIALAPDMQLVDQAAFFGLDALGETHQIILLPIDTLAAGETRSSEIRLKAPWTYLTMTAANITLADASGAWLAQAGTQRTAVAGGAIPIGTARGMANQEIIVEGIATMYSGGYYAGSGNTKFYIEDETGGLQVWVDDGETDVHVALGDRVRVRGMLLVYRNAMELAPTSAGVEVIEKGTDAASWPALTVSVEDAANDAQHLAGRLIQTEGTVARIEEFSYSYEIDLVDESGNLASIYVDKLTEINMEAIQSGETYRVTGVVEVTDDTPRIYPRIQSDLAKVYPPVLEVVINAPAAVKAGEEFSVTLTITNYTPDMLTDVAVTAPLPAYDFRVLAIADGGVEENKTITWTIPQLAAEGGAVRVSYQALLVTRQASIQLKPAQASAEGVEPAESLALDVFIGDQVPVWAIQGVGERSPYVGESVTTTGVVTGIFPALDGFWIQSKETDYDSRTSDGLFVCRGALADDLRPGDWVQVSGVVREAYQQTCLEIAAAQDVVTLSSAHTLPVAEELNPPAEIEASLAYYESLEGMFVQITQAAFVVAPSNRYGEYTLVRADQGVTRLWQGQENGNAIVVDDGSNIAHDDRSTMAYVVNSGDQVTNLIGPLAFTYGQYKIEPVAKPAVLAVQADLPSLPALATDEFSLMTWNVENLFDFTDPHPSSPPMPSIDEYRIQIAKVANTIVAAGAPIIVGLQEVENIGILEDIVAQEALAGYDYQAVLIEGTDSRYIEVGYLVRGDQAQILRQEQYPAPDGLTSRPPLLVAVEIVTSQGAQTLFLLNNHFTSMSGGEAATEPRRNAQAAWNVSVMQELLADESGLLAVMGDLNSYYDSLPIETLRQAGLVHVFEAIPAEARYTYIYQGQSQVLDHILVTPPLMALLRRVDVLHVNADYALPAAEDTSPLHKSDHDPVVAVFAVAP